MKPLLKNFVKVNDNPTKKYALIGKTAIVTTKFDAVTNKGQIKVEGAVWTAISGSGETQEVGQNVKIVKIDGIKLVDK